MLHGRNRSAQAQSVKQHDSRHYLHCQYASSMHQYTLYLRASACYTLLRDATELLGALRMEPRPPLEMESHTHTTPTPVDGFVYRVRPEVARLVCDKLHALRVAAGGVDLRVYAEVRVRLRELKQQPIHTWLLHILQLWGREDRVKGQQCG